MNRPTRTIRVAAGALLRLELQILQPGDIGVGHTDRTWTCPAHQGDSGTCNLEYLNTAAHNRAVGDFAVSRANATAIRSDWSLVTPGTPTGQQHHSNTCSFIYVSHFRSGRPRRYQIFVQPDRDSTVKTGPAHPESAVLAIKGRT